MPQWLKDLLNNVALGTAPAHGPRLAFENRVPAQRLAGARFEVKNAAENPDTADLYIYGDIAFYDITAQMVANALAACTAKTLRVRINSCGGDVFDGVAIYNLLRSYARQNNAAVEVHVDGIAASIASVIAMAGTSVVMAKNAMMMIHRASGGCYGDADDMAAMSAVLVSLENDMIVPTYAAKTGMTPADLVALMKQSTWMNAQACVDRKFADKIEDDSGVTALIRPGAFDNLPAELKNAADWQCAAATDLPIDKADSWDGAAAAERMLDAAGFNGAAPDSEKACRGFLAADKSAPAKKESYKLPFADIVSGTLTAMEGGLGAAASRLPDTDIPQSVKDSARKVLDDYYARRDDEQGKSNRTRVARMRARMAALSVETH